jgi:hypothetical protein
MSWTALLLALIVSGTTGAPIMTGSLGLSPGEAKWYTIAVPADYESATLDGDFTASGGSGNDVEVFVLDQAGLTNWRNGHTVPTHYDSGRITTGTVSANLEPGRTYYLVFSNRFSPFSAKTVTGEIHLSLYKPSSSLEGVVSAEKGQGGRSRGVRSAALLVGGIVLVAFLIGVLGLALVFLGLRATRRKGDTASGFCPMCGGKTIAGATFCHSCGARLGEPSAPEKTQDREIDPPARNHPG